MRWCRTQASSHISPVVVDGRVNKAGVCIAAPDRSAILCCWMHQSKGDCAQRYCSRSPTGASKPLQQRDEWCQLPANWLKVLAIRERRVWHYPKTFGLGWEGQHDVVVVDLPSLLLRWKTDVTVFLVLSLSFLVWNSHLWLPCSCTAPLPLPAGLHQHPWLRDGQHIHTFWRRLLAGQRCRCWRKGLPGLIPVGRRAEGFVTCSACKFRW